MLSRRTVSTSRIRRVSLPCKSLLMAGFFVTFSAQSGGIFVDMGVHDVSFRS